MCKILIFGGTTEGRELAEFCEKNKIRADVSVATEYGAKLLSQSEYIKIFTGKLDCDQMRDFISSQNYTVIIDATHPYAVDATKNITAACKKTGTEYFRLLRENNSGAVGTIVADMTELIAYLNKSDKIILSTLGSKELPKFTAVKDFYERVWIRVLPADGVVDYCINLGFDKSKIILGKGPFSADENIRHIRMCAAEILVTKESGSVGGYSEKIAAAEQCDIETVTIKRPVESGYDFVEIQKIIMERSK